MHAPGCPEVDPDAPPGRYYSPADVAELCGVARQYMTPILNRWRAGTARPNDPPILLIGDRPAIEHEALIRWLAEHRPKWRARMEQAAIRSRLCVGCGERDKHLEGCWKLIPVAQRKHLDGFCSDCGEKMVAAHDYGQRTCLSCKTVRNATQREKRRASA